MARSRPWTTSDEDALRAVYDDMRSQGGGRGRLKRLAADLERSTGAVYHRAGKLGLTGGRKHRWHADEDAALRDLRNRGWRIERIAAALGRTPESVRMRIKTRGGGADNHNSKRLLSHD